MKHKMKKNTCSLISGIILFYLLSTVVHADNGVPSHTRRFFVNDFAGVLSQDTEDYIFNTSKLYKIKGGPQVVVTTINSLDGANINEYALEMVQKWEIGNSEEYNGILILIAIKERAIRLEVGYGLDGIITPDMSENFLKEVAADLEKEDFDTGVKSLYSLIINEIKQPGTFNAETSSKNVNASTRLGSIFLVLLLVGLMILGRFLHPCHRNYRFGSYLRGCLKGHSSDLSSDSSDGQIGDSDRDG